ncbi:MAG: glycosyltransferase family 2 protein [Candidatus Moraniibacteriota bacterium]
MNTDSHNRNVWIVIPAYNEGAVIAGVIAQVRAAGYKNILVVDDGSADTTADKARKAGAEVLSLVINRGQGAALRTGIEYLRETEDPDIIVTFDADGQHRSEDIAALMLPIVEDRADVVLGSRFLEKNGTEIPLIRTLVLKAGILFTNIVSGVRLTDTHNGFRALGKKAIREIGITQRGMEHASEIIDCLSRKQLRYVEVPVHIEYSDYSLGKGQCSSAFIKIGAKVIVKKLID